MQVQPISNNIDFGNAKGGIRYLKIIKTSKGIKLTTTTKEASNLGIFVAGGPEIDKKVNEANLMLSRKLASKPSIKK